MLKVSSLTFFTSLIAYCLTIPTADAQCSAEDISSYVQGGASAEQLSQLCGSSAGGNRYVVVNGAQLDHSEIRYLEGLACTSIPDGEYWLDTGSGIWGYAGDPRPRGRIGDRC